MDEDLQDKISRHVDLIKNIKVRIKEPQRRYKKYFDKGRISVRFKTGQLVKVRNEADDISFPKKKIAWRGPFKIVGKRSDRFYFVLRTVRTPSGQRKFVVKEYHIRNIRDFVKRPKYLKMNKVNSEILNINLPFGQEYAMHHREGDLLEAPSHFCLAHCCSEDLKLGAGVARTIQEKYAVREEMLRQDHSIGSAVMTSSRGRVVYNLVTKRRFFDKPTYGSLEHCLRDLRRQMAANGHWYLAIPELGCGRDGLRLDVVTEILDKIFRGSGMKIVMCHYQPTWETRKPQGLSFC